MAEFQLPEGIPGLDELHKSLFEVVKSGDLEAVRKIFDLGQINLEAKNEEGYTLLMTAAAEGHDNIVFFLCNRGADIGGKDDDGETALHVAAAHGLTSTVSLLLLFHAPVDAQDINGFTAFHEAAIDGHVDTLFVLLKDHANMFAVDDHGWTALHHASANGLREVVRFLSPFLNKKLTNDGKSAEDIASERAESLQIQYPLVLSEEPLDLDGSDSGSVDESRRILYKNLTTCALTCSREYSDEERAQISSLWTDVPVSPASSPRSANTNDWAFVQMGNNDRRAFYEEQRRRTRAYNRRTFRKVDTRDLKRVDRFAGYRGCAADAVSPSYTRQEALIAEGERRAREEAKEKQDAQAAAAPQAASEPIPAAQKDIV